MAFVIERALPLLLIAAACSSGAVGGSTDASGGDAMTQDAPSDHTPDGTAIDAAEHDVGTPADGGSAGGRDAGPGPGVDGGGGGSDSGAMQGTPMFVAVGYAGRRMTSLDGVTWTNDVHDPNPVMGDNNQQFRSVGYGAGLYVAVGGGSLVGRIESTRDGVLWTDASDNKGWLGGVAYGNGMFVAAGSNGRHLRSMDGMTWTDGARDFMQHYRAIAFGNGRFIAVGDLGRRTLTQDGVTFTDNMIGGDGLASIAFGNGRFVAVGQNGRRIVTTDGSTWTNDTVGGNMLSGVTFANGMFVAVGSSRVLVSPDGVTWNEHTMIPALNGIAFGAAGFVGIGWRDERFTSGDALAWTMRAGSMDPSTFALEFVTYGGE